VRLVLDTNVVASGLLWAGGPPAQLIDAAQAGAVELFTSKTLLAELTRILARTKLARAVATSTLSIDELVLGYAELATIMTPANIAPTSADPDDNHVLACALAAQVDLIVSGDPHLLDLKQFHSMPIVTPREAVARITA
jgi:putative PIN family toxin of toxin-antitoxin system